MPLDDVLYCILGGGSWESSFCVITALFLSFNYFGRTLFFLSAATAHYYRVYLLLTFLLRLIRVVPETHPNFPVLQLTYVTQPHMRDYSKIQLSFIF